MVLAVYIWKLCTLLYSNALPQEEKANMEAKKIRSLAQKPETGEAPDTEKSSKELVEANVPNPDHF